MADRHARRQPARRLRAVGAAGRLRRGGARGPGVTDGNDYLVSGTKAWITHAGEADFYTLMVRTSDDRSRGVSCLLADAATPGLTVAAAEHKMGLTGSPTTQILLEQPRIGAPPDRGRGRRAQVRARRAQLRPARHPACASASPRGRWTKRSPGRSSGPSSGSRSSTSRGWSSCWRTWRRGSIRPRDLPGRRPPPGSGMQFRRQASIAKLVATDMAMRVTTDAVQVLGGYGYTGDFRSNGTCARRRCRGSSRAPTRSSAWSSRGSCARPKSCVWLAPEGLRKRQRDMLKKTRVIAVLGAVLVAAALADFWRSRGARPRHPRREIGRR